MIGVGVGIGMRSRLFRLTDVANIVADWNPAFVTKDVSNLTAQLDDASGQGNHMLQSSGVVKPTWVSSLASANGAPALQLAGAQYMQLGTGSQLSYERTQPWTIGCVVRVTGAGTDQCILAKGNPASIGYGISCGNGGTTANLRAGLAASGANRVIGDGSIALKDVTRVIRVTYDGSSTVGGLTMTVNGVSVSVAATVNSLSATIVSANKFTLGWNAIGAYLTGYFVRGYMATRAIAGAEGSKVDRHLGALYGVAVA